MKQNVFRAETRCCTWNLVVVLGSMLFLLNNVSSWPAVAASGVLPATELANIIVHVMASELLYDCVQRGSNLVERP
jgi:hypothetical protein